LKKHRNYTENIKNEMNKYTPLFLTLIFQILLAQADWAQTILIGGQTWSTTNLDVTHFRNGDSITEAKTNEDWILAGENKKPAWCYYNNDAKNSEDCGKIYNWYAVNDMRGLAPQGYHIPTIAEWDTLSVFLDNDACIKMKTTYGWEEFNSVVKETCKNCSDWNDEYRKHSTCQICSNKRTVEIVVGKSSGSGTNSCGFSGLPCGWRHMHGDFKSYGTEGGWWSYSKNDPKGSWYFILLNNHRCIGRYDKDKEGLGLAVRCIKD
jgi:uncharacterized protein (TIGR02145 family)